MTDPSLQETIKAILAIQELDIQMIQLLRLRKERKRELDNIHVIKNNLKGQVTLKESEILELKTTIRITEGELREIIEKGKRLEEQQSQIKKVEEFNALTHEMAQANREKTAKESRLSDLYDKLATEEEMLKNLQENYASTEENSKVVVNEIQENIANLNEEGRSLKVKRDEQVKAVNPEVFAIYERLLRNKKDRVVVPIENRCCTGCHIMVTAQDENLVRKGERLVFCEHCSRIHFWPEHEELEGTAGMPKPRRRRSQSAA